ncbi:hypothetical protein ACFC96_24660 [Streptomyces sp. NPDC055955]|uniref:hypothetical protein n=1 Tax=Streptomyces sp. NPDC055955 TaxID=3345665 RepID=UPI0035D95C91
MTIGPARGTGARLQEASPLPAEFGAAADGAAVGSLVHVPLATGLPPVTATVSIAAPRSNAVRTLNTPPPPRT